MQKKLVFPDHYKFSKLEVQKMIDESNRNNWELVTTEKDFFRIKHYGFKNVKFLKIKLEILEKDRLINQILNCLC